MDEIAKAADKLWFYSKDKCDNPNSSEAQKLIGAFRQLHHDAKNNRDEDYVFEKVREIERMLLNLKNRDDVYDHVHVDDMYDRCQDLKRDIREL